MSGGIRIRPGLRKPINPSQFRFRVRAFLIIEHVVWKFVLNGDHLPEHQQAGHSDSTFACFTIFSPAADLPQELSIRNSIPGMIWIAIGKDLSEIAKRASVQITDVVSAQNSVIPAVFHLLSQHPFDFILRYWSVAIIETPICVSSQRIGRQKDWPLPACGAWNFDDENRATFQRDFPHG